MPKRSTPAPASAMSKSTWKRRRGGSRNWSRSRNSSNALETPAPSSNQSAPRPTTGFIAEPPVGVRRSSLAPSIASLSSSRPTPELGQESRNITGYHGNATLSRSTAMRPPATPASRLSRSTMPVSPAQTLSSVCDRTSQLPDMPEDQDIDALNEVIMAIDMKHNKVMGCAYYVVLEQTLFIQEDIPSANIEVVRTLLIQVEPTTVLIPLRCPDELVECLEAEAQHIDGYGGSETRGAHIIRTLSSAEFGFDNGQRQLLRLDLDDLAPTAMNFATVAEEIPEDAVGDEGHIQSARGRLMRFATHINFESRLSIGCVGAVLSDIQRRRAAECLPHDPAARALFRVREIRMCTLADSMFVDADTMNALQILGSENHPNAMTQGSDSSKSGSKKTLSVYGLFHFLAYTPQGRIHLRRIFMRPSTNLDLILERQSTIALLRRPENSDIVANMGKLLPKIRNMKTTLTHLRKGINLSTGRANVGQSIWATLQSFAAYSLLLREAVHSLAGGHGVLIVNRVLEGIAQRDLRVVGELINTTIDFQQSTENRRITIAQGVDPALDEYKRRYDGLDSLLNSAAYQLTLSIPEWARQYVRNCLFYPQLGFLTAVAIDPETGQSCYDGEAQDGDPWEPMYTDAEAGCICYKNGPMRSMDEHCGDLYTMILDKEIDIVHDLSVRVLDHESALIDASEVCGEFDSLLALARGAERHGLVAPTMSTSNFISVTGGRHLLHEGVVSAFVANDTDLFGGAGDPEADSSMSVTGMSEMPDDRSPPNLMVLTGPNHSGKSVYLKQVALIVFLAHTGSYVPAEKASIGITDRILSRISTRETVSRQESAFAIDLKQAAFSINFATRRSLVLIDEFGKGTNPTDGAALLTALLSHFLRLGVEAPKILAATHFHEILEGGYLDACPKPVPAYGHMEVHIDKERSSHEDQVTYLYQLAPGLSTSSFGSACAAMNGVSAEVVERSEAIAKLLTRGEDLRTSCARLSDVETTKLETAEIAARDLLDVDFDDLQVIDPQSRRFGLRRIVRDQLASILATNTFDGSSS